MTPCKLKDCAKESSRPDVGSINNIHIVDVVNAESWPCDGIWYMYRVRTIVGARAQFRGGPTVAACARATRDANRVLTYMY